MIIERLIYGKKIKEIGEGLNVPNILRMALTFCIVSFAWIFFRAESLGDAVEIIGRIFTSRGSLFIDVNTLLMAFLALAVVFMYDFTHEYGLRLRFLNSRFKVVRYATAVLLICYIIGFGVLNSGSFIYFQF